MFRSAVCTHIFSKLVLRSMYNLVCIRAGDEWKTTFITPSGHYESQVMPCDLSNSPSIFQCFMNKVFLHQFVIVYIDDILIYSWNLAEHRHHMTYVLQRLRVHHLYLKLEKCEFHHSTVQFLGYKFSLEGIQMDQGKTNGIQEWPLPQSVKELQRLLAIPLELLEEATVYQVRDILDSRRRAPGSSTCLTGRKDPGWPGTIS